MEKHRFRTNFSDNASYRIMLRPIEASRLPRRSVLREEAAFRPPVRGARRMFLTPRTFGVLCFRWRKRPVKVMSVLSWNRSLATGERFFVGLERVGRKPVPRQEDGWQPDPRFLDNVSVFGPVPFLVSRRIYREQLMTKFRVINGASAPPIAARLPR